MSYRAIADILGIQDPTDTIELHAIARKGLPAEVAGRLAIKLGISVEDLSHCLRIPILSLIGNKGERLSPHISDRLIKVAELYVRCKEVFETDAKSVTWLKSIIPALGGTCPIDHLGTGSEIDAVRVLLGRIEHGVHS